MTSVSPSLLPAPCSLLPAPCSLKPKKLYFTSLKTAIPWIKILNLLY
ncbi:MAG: hypothetical protein F6K50_01060 [Moorea sp. SIO3I7]|nr:MULTISPECIES: hypothetical protein [unclassified Moorena]NEN94189.1 hypothetical protein [Moorena sp. SIO3I7]NEO04764.1 hypothetical protein [Moorena sp. SIO3I8]NEO17919.1 hypothetical protein [Moorena sp. SIO4A5]NEP21021.1 hypothetical protein [Moorena sp. SIO3I6]NEQ56314.1 hypothetical protein [Moorena sp. SIO4A1]